MESRNWLLILALASGLLLSPKNCDADRVCELNGQTRHCYTGPKGTRGAGV